MIKAIKSKFYKFEFMFITCVLISILFSQTIYSSSEFTAKSQKTISVMTYNLENLFDTLDDPKKNDEAYLPKAYKMKNQKILQKCQRIKDYRWRSECLDMDWTKQAMHSKMKRISDVILKSHSWKGPDILILQEVENLNTAETLRTKYLKKHYPHKAILIEGIDERGIDVAILSKFPLNSPPLLHPVTARGILEAEFKHPDKTLIKVFVVHFPSQRSPFSKRKSALEKLNKIISRLADDVLVIVAGDMNVSDEELKKLNPFKDFKKQFYISHIDGCFQCLGTHYYGPKKSWSFLDVIMVSKSQPTWKLNLETVSIFNRSLYQTDKTGLPQKFNLGQKQTGVSDHWPLKLEIFKN